MKWLSAALLALASLALAAPPVAAGSCPDGFHLHAVADGDHEPGEHRHAGVPEALLDRNGNGFICVKHVTPSGDIHVHIDDVLP